MFGGGYLAYASDAAGDVGVFLLVPELYGGLGGFVRDCFLIFDGLGIDVFSVGVDGVGVAGRCGSLFASVELFLALSSCSLRS